jgi:SET domain-containing protein
MCAAQNHIFVLMKASKNIQKGEELLYNYNGRLSEYDIELFAKL